MKTSAEGVRVILTDDNQPIAIIRKDMQSSGKENIMYMLTPATEDEMANIIEGRAADTPVSSQG